MMDGEINPVLTTSAGHYTQPESSRAMQPSTSINASTWLRRNGPTYRPYVLAALAIAAMLVLWDFLTVFHMVFYVRFYNLPTPAQVLVGAESAFSDGTLLTDILVSCRRILFGFFSASIVAVPLGILMGRFRIINEVVFPVAEVLRPIPAIAWVPISIMIWPTTEESIVFITFLGSFFPILINTLHGMATLDPVLVRAARCLGASEKSMFLEIYLPGILPQIFTGFTVGMGVAWVSLIAAEMIAGQYGIGYFTWEAYSLIQYQDIVLGMILIGVLGLLFSGAIILTGRALMPWLVRR